MASTYFKSWRLFRGLTQEEAADLSGLSQGTIARLETGAREYREHHLDKLAIAYRCEKWELIGRKPDEDASDGVIDIYSRIPPDKREQAKRTLASFASPKKEAG